MMPDGGPAVNETLTGGETSSRRAGAVREAGPDTPLASVRSLPVLFERPPGKCEALTRDVASAIISFLDFVFTKCRFRHEIAP